MLFFASLANKNKLLINHDLMNTIFIITMQIYIKDILLFRSILEGIYSISSLFTLLSFIDTILVIPEMKIFRKDIIYK